jgi:hypothetical protein
MDYIRREKEQQDSVGLVFDDDVSAVFKPWGTVRWLSTGPDSIGHITTVKRPPHFPSKDASVHAEAKRSRGGEYGGGSNRPQ